MNSNRMTSASALTGAWLCAAAAVAPAHAITVAIQYTGFVNNAFSQSTGQQITSEFVGQPYKADYVFDLSGNPAGTTMSPQYNDVIGGTWFGLPSPVVSATLTIGTTVLTVPSPDFIGLIAGLNNGSFAEQIHDAKASQFVFMRHDIFYDASQQSDPIVSAIPASITSNFTYSLEPGAEYFAQFCDGTFCLDLTPQTLAETVVTPLPAALPLFAAGLGALGLLGWRRRKKTAAALAA
jgi:hypothetical protein